MFDSKKKMLHCFYDTRGSPNRFAPSRKEAGNNNLSMIATSRTRLVSMTL